MDPVVDFNLDSLKSDEDGGHGDTAENSMTYPPLDHDKDFELHTLVPNRDIEIHAVQTPTPDKTIDTNVDEETRFPIPSTSLATMESLEYSIVEGNIIFYHNHISTISITRAKLSFELSM